jgi:UDP-N-acetylglucosamine--dolichyl-phosphate N-acetylglucosaminephosphotransferase
MIDYLLFIPVLTSFFITLFFLPIWIKKARQINLFWNDMNKIENNKVAGSGGLIATWSFLISALIFIAYRTFYLKSPSNLIEILAVLLVITMLSSIGFIDDLLGWQKGGLSKRSRIILFIIASIPLMVINAGRHVISLPFFGQIDMGLLYPFFLIPLGMAGAAATFNFLAGFNGLEAGQGILILSALSLTAFLTGSSWLAVIILCMVASLFAFLFYNFYPAKVFPGNSITLAIGGLIAISAILGNFEKIALFFFIPYILETILKLRGKLLKQSFGKPLKDGTLDLKYVNIYGLTHASIWILKKLNVPPTEKRVVYIIWLFQLAVIILGFIIFRKGIF